MTREIEFTLTGCVDCKIVKAMAKDEIDTTHPGFVYGSEAVRIWKNPDGKHYLIVVSTRPQRVFLSCQPPNKLLTESGVAEILNFVESIPKTSEDKGA